MSNPNKDLPERPIVANPDNPTMTKTLSLEFIQISKQPGDRETVEDQSLEQQAIPEARSLRNVDETAQNEPKADLSMTASFHPAHQAIEQSETTMNAAIKAAVTNRDHPIVGLAI